MTSVINNPRFEKLLNRFPDIELSYGKNVHNKVQKYDVAIAIPKGQKYFAWFTYFENENVCILLEISKGKMLTNMYTYITSFDSTLSLGTILYGTFFENNDLNLFSIEDIFYYCGKNISNYTFFNKLNNLTDLMTSKINQVSYINNSILFGLPLMYKSDYTLFKEINNLIYPIYAIQYRNEQNNIKYNYKYVNIQQSYLVFNIKPGIQNDIYYLYCLDNNREVLYNVAHIPDYKTSIFMNKLFRNIKENDYLDKLEESDDEEAFENISDDKYVYLEKEYKIRCVYNNKFKRWVPIELANNDETIINKSKIFNS